MLILKPNWPQPDNIQAFTTLKDCKLEQLELPANVISLQQNHGNTLIHIDSHTKLQESFNGDGSYTQLPQVGCMVKTADCLPILVTNLNGTLVAALHAGWRGLAQGIIACFFKKLDKLAVQISQLLFWFGPAIGPNDFEVGSEVVAQFNGKLYHKAFTKLTTKPNQYLADLYKIAAINLYEHNIKPDQIYSQYYSTLAQPAKFYSHRFKVGLKERMYSFIWIKS